MGSGPVPYRGVERGYQMADVGTTQRGFEKVRIGVLSVEARLRPVHTRCGGDCTDAPRERDDAGDERCGVPQSQTVHRPPSLTRSLGTSHPTSCEPVCGIAAVTRERRLTVIATNATLQHWLAAPARPVSHEQCDGTLPNRPCPVRLVAQDTALSRRRPSVRIRYGVPASVARGHVSVHPAIHVREVVDRMLR